ncbi:hypothetical protein WJX73_009948 [Symbiochloris irregularis]|uniref:Uncharacterized protein n=1 Tax=Symbiochloris irregularis TaxID=706552 RepID=A0AAW1NR40_9CHLO
MPAEALSEQLMEGSLGQSSVGDSQSNTLESRSDPQTASELQARLKETSSSPRSQEVAHSSSHPPQSERE